MAKGLSAALDDATRAELLRTMIRVRVFEEAALRAAATLPQRSGEAGYPSFEVSAGREPVGAGICAHLGPQDAVSAADRTHHLAIAHGVDLRKLAVEAVGTDATGTGGRSRWHMFDPDTQFTGSTSTAEGYPPALGRAFAHRQRGTGRIAVAVIDRHSATQPGFREALDLALLWDLPLIFLVEDDDWNGAAPYSRAYTDAIGPALEYGGAPAERVEANAVESIYAAAERAVGRARAGMGPSVIEVHTLTLWISGAGSRSGLEPDLTGRVGVDPVATYESVLREAGILDVATIAEIRSTETERVEEAITAALSPSAPSPAGDDAVSVSSLGPTESVEPSEADESDAGPFELRSVAGGRSEGRAERLGEPLDDTDGSTFQRRAAR